MVSYKYELNKEDGIKILKGVGIAAGGAVVAFLINVLPQVNFQGYEYIVIPVVSALLNAGRKWLSGKDKIV